MKILIFCILTLSCLNLNAQLEFSPVENTQEFNLDLSDAFVSGRIESFLLNQTASSVSLKWEVFEIDAPDEWEMQLTVADDGGGGFSWGVTSNFASTVLPNPIPLPIAIADSSKMNLAVRPKGVAGCGTYEIHISLVDDPEQIVAIGTYNFFINVNTDCITSTRDDFDDNPMVIYPNPTDNYFTISNNPKVRTVEVFNMVGTPMIRTPFQMEEEIDISSFPKGVYLIMMLDKNGKTLSTARLAKK